jgi:hypothetical protein
MMSIWATAALLYGLTAPPSAFDVPDLPQPDQLPIPKLESAEALPMPMQESLEALQPPPYEFPHRKSHYAVWEYYAVSRDGHFRPRVVYSGNSNAYYLYNGEPYPWMSTHQLDIMPYVVDSP